MSHLHRLSPPLLQFSLSLFTISIPNSLQEALQHPGWRAAMVEEMIALWADQSWDLVPLPPDQFCVSCKRVFAIKHAPDDTVERLKARLVAKGLTQQHDIDYDETFSLVAKLNTVRVLISLAVHRQWPLHQPDIKNVFLNDDLQETIKDLSNLQYFLGLEVARRPDGIVLSQQKYCIDLLQDACYSGCKPADTPMDVNHKLFSHYFGTDLVLTKSEYYRRLVGKLIYLTVTRPDISFVVGVRSKKLSVVARSSAEAEYRAMTPVLSELTWLESLFSDLSLKLSSSATLFCDSQAVIHIARNLVFHERTKHIEVDRHFIREKVQSKKLELVHVSASGQVADIFTKALSQTLYHQFLSKLGAYDLYAPACGGVSDITESIKPDGSLLGDLDLIHHKPYEYLLLGYVNGKSGRFTRSFLLDQPHRTATGLDIPSVHSPGNVVDPLGVSAPFGDPSAPHLCRLNIPVFNETDPMGWLARTEQYFDLQGTPEAQKGPLAMMYMEGSTLYWVRWLRQSTPTLPWAALKDELLCRYDTPFRKPLRSPKQRSSDRHR
ncbi:hypothetical protein KSP40_PGU009074 [Platanthera guangdongensis]|uniref:Reverse transcriptase Ty1/copia-type domain-containing protein n=1 Tax=Platanthera guangdongensis TaxID=2320717 RepID=A0ABR2MDB6_9ASPA